MHTQENRSTQDKTKKNNTQIRDTVWKAKNQVRSQVKKQKTTNNVNNLFSLVLVSRA